MQGSRGGSRPVRARGLKRHIEDGRVRSPSVAPRAGAWIETAGLRIDGPCYLGRAPCGRVD